MRTRLLFGAVALVAFFMSFFMSPALMGQDSSLGSDGVTVGISTRQEVDSEIFNLQKNIKASKNQTQALKALEKTEAQIGAIRARSARQIEPDEIYMDMLVATLKEIPRGKSFKAANCGQYRNKILAQYDPKGEVHPTSPAVEKTLDVLKALCR